MEDADWLSVTAENQADADPGCLLLRMTPLEVATTFSYCTLADLSRMSGTCRFDLTIMDSLCEV
jgi:hypothetical protein